MDELKSIYLLTKYNFKILFGGNFIIFILLSLLLFCYLIFDVAYSGYSVSDSTIYENLIMPSLLLIFYPTAYGIQRDEECKILEIFFCIPNYMYKVWLLRLLYMFIAEIAIIMLFSYLSHLLLSPIEVVNMSYQIMFVVLFFGSLSMMLSTMIKSGNGVAVVLLGLFSLLVYMGSSSQYSMWNILINPFKSPNNIHPDMWLDTVRNSRLLLGCSSIGMILISLNNLRCREKLL